MEEFFALARKILAEQMDVDPETLTMETTFEEIDADSIDIVEMIMALEDVYDVEFPEDEKKDYAILGVLITDLYEYLRQIKNA
ncbi:MAG: acyl carrier protein [Syntrophomonadaceae bacterium]|nr:acyl carrier protein [Syntrophomonadaceae bacterium]